MKWYIVRFKRKQNPQGKWFEFHFKGEDPWDALRIAQQAVKDPQGYEWKVDEA